MKPGFSVWIKDDEDERIFGEGPYELLILIDKLGSINKASIEMKMSYSKTMNIIKKCETSLNLKLLEREVGGAYGGGSKLTKAAKALIERYEKFRETSYKAIEEIFNETFQT